MPYFNKTPTGRLKAPDFYTKLEEADITGVRVDWKGDPVAKIGDYVLTSGKGISAGTVGKLISTENLQLPGKHPWWSGQVETLDGKTKCEWLWSLTVIPVDAVNEVKQFYTDQGRPERIKVDW